MAKLASVALRCPAGLNCYHGQVGLSCSVWPNICHIQKSEISPHDKFLYRYIGGIVDKYEVCSTWPLTVSRFALFFVLVFAILHVSYDAANALICHVLHEFDKY